MKKILFVLILIINLYGGNAIVDGSKAFEEYENGNKKASPIEIGYYLGIIDGVKVLNNVIYCLPRNTSTGQLAAIVRKYIKNNPEKWNRGTWDLVVVPLKIVFPCKKKN